MPLSIQRKVLLAFGIALLALTAMGAASYVALRDAVETSGWVEHTHAVLAKLAEIHQDVSEAESGVRGYLLTENRAFLAPFENARTHSERDVRALRAMVADNPDQVVRADSVAASVHRRLMVMASPFAVAGDSSNTATALIPGLVQDGTRSEPHRWIARMIVTEQALLRERQAREGMAVRRAVIVIVAGFIVALLVGLGATMAVRRDMSTHERMQRELSGALLRAQAANRAKTDFLARMSHELRTPLNSVIGFSNILLKNKRGALDEQEVSYLDRIQSNGRHLLAIINDILDLAKVEAGRLDLEISNVELTALIRDTVAELGSRDAVTISIEAPDEVLPLATDRARFRQVLVNLLSNAAKFTERGRVLVKLHVDPDTHAPRRLDVVDTGVGIAPDRLDAIFHAFEQAEVTTARRFGGTGLGLAISQSLSQRMGYRLTVVSTPGLGSTFSILLVPDEAAPSMHMPPPYTVAAAAARLPVSERLAPLAHGESTVPVVLVIDDSSDSRLLISQFAEDAGCQALLAVNGEQGLQMALEFHPDLITLDLHMPGMDGLDVLRRLKMHPGTANIPVVVVSIVASEQRGAIVGAVDVVDKPVNRDELVGAIRRNLGAGRSRVLVVEDDRDARTLIEAHLQDFPGVDVLSASDGDEALGVAVDFGPDLVILDLTLPRVSGVEFLKRFRAIDRFADVPVVVATAKVLTEEERRALQRDTLALLPKGAEFGERLQRTIRGALRDLREQRQPV